MNPSMRFFREDEAARGGVWGLQISWPERGDEWVVFFVFGVVHRWCLS